MFTQITKQYKRFQILEHHINILEWFLKDHVTLKTGAIAEKMQLCNHKNKFHFKIYQHRKRYYYNNIFIIFNLENSA